MKIETYKKIQKFYSDNKYTSTELNFAMQGFVQTYFDTIKAEITEDIIGDDRIAKIQIIEDTLSSESSLRNIFNNAKNTVSNYETNLEKTYKSKNTRSFWGSVWVSIVANFAYSALLIIIFALARDQIKSWLMSLLNAS